MTAPRNGPGPGNDGAPPGRSPALPQTPGDNRRRFAERFEYVLGQMGPDTFFLYGVDLTTGERVAIEQRGPSWEHDILVEAIARRAATVRSRSLARVLHAGPGVVLAMPPPAVPPSTLRALGAADASDLALRAGQVAAELALQACEVAAALHAAGVAGLPFDERNPRLAFDDGGRPIVHNMVQAKPLGDTLFT